MSLAYHALADLEALAYEGGAGAQSLATSRGGREPCFRRLPTIMLGVRARPSRQRGHARRDPRRDRIEYGALFDDFETNPGVAFVALTPPTTVELRDRMVSELEP